MNINEEFIKNTETARDKALRFIDAHIAIGRFRAFDIKIYIDYRCGGSGGFIASHPLRIAMHHTSRLPCNNRHWINVGNRHLLQ